MVGFTCDGELIADLTVRERLATFVVSHRLGDIRIVSRCTSKAYRVKGKS
jgi:hypothetical protein